MVYHKIDRISQVENQIYPDDVEICLFVKDPSKIYKEQVREMMIPNIKKVSQLILVISQIIGVKSLREKYNRFEARRKLVNSYDLFLCDDNISLVLPKLLGKIFFKPKKFPVPVKLNQNLPEHVNRAINSTQLNIKQGPCLYVNLINLMKGIFELG